MSTLITICARGGSKGIPGKNIKSLNRKPLIYYTLKIASTYASLNEDVDIYLSTDSSEIKNVVEDLDISQVKTGYVRPSHLANDTSGKMDVIKDVLSFAEKEKKAHYNYIIDLDVTSPLRSIEDIEAAFKKISDVPEALDIFSVSPANRNPYFNMVEQQNGGEFVKLVKSGSFLTRQSAPVVYDLNASFYIYRRRFFELNSKTPITQRSLVYVVPHICFDLDHPLDFEFMTFLIENNKLDFNFLI